MLALKLLFASKRVHWGDKDMSFLLYLIDAEGMVS